MNKLIVENGGKREEFVADGPVAVHKRPGMAPIHSDEGHLEAWHGAPGKTHITSSATGRESNESRVVWQNECALVPVRDGPVGFEGEMGLCYPPPPDMDGPPREVTIAIRENGGDELRNQLVGCSVRVTVEIVRGGNI